MALQATSPSPAKHGPAFRFFFVHEIHEYPRTARRTGYLAVAIAATIVLYYTYYTQFGVTPNILRSYHMSFEFYVWIVIVSNALGAFASLPASKTDQLGRSNTIIYGLFIIGLLIAVGVPNAGTEWVFAVVICMVGIVEGAILVATPAMVRDYSPQLGRASAMGFWTIGPVAGSLIVSIVATRTLNHFVDWQSQFIISGLVAIATGVISLLFLKDLSAKLRDQLMVSSHDRALLEARARGLSVTDVRQAMVHPWRQILKWDLVGLSVGIAVFLLVYYVAASFFTVYYTVTFLNPNGTNLTTAQVNGLNQWFWGGDIIALILVGILSDLLKVRKPLMVVGTFGAIASLIVFISYASHPHTGFDKIIITEVIIAACLSLVFAPWMAGYTETVEAKNPALVGTGLALWGWILRSVVAISFVFLPHVITSVNPVVDNQQVATTVVAGQSIADFAAKHPDSVAFAQEHAALLKTISPYSATLAKASTSSNPTAAKIGLHVAAEIGPTAFKQVLALQNTLKTLVQPYTAQLNYLSAHQAQLTELQNGIKQSPKQWQKWFWIDLVGMIVFFPTIWLLKGRWSPRRARRDEQEHEKAVADELAQLLKEEGVAAAS
jgi:MFS family permease